MCCVVSDSPVSSAPAPLWLEHTDKHTQEADGSIMQFFPRRAEPVALKRSRTRFGLVIPRLFVSL